MAPTHLTLIICFFLVSRASAECLCRDYHPQEMICRSDFVGEILITNDGLSTDASSDDTTTVVVAAKARINKIYKGGYEDFDEGSEVTLYTPAGSQSCRKEFEAGEQLVAAKLFRGGLLMDSCDFQVQMDWFSSDEQPQSIRRNIRSKAYRKGCDYCRIKRPKEKSFVYHDECQAKCEFPVSTAACVPTGADGRCAWNNVVHDDPARPEKGPSEAPDTQQGDNGALDALGHEEPPNEASKRNQNKKIGGDGPDEKPDVVINTITYPFTFKPTKDDKEGIVTHIMRVLWPFRKR